MTKRNQTENRDKQYWRTPAKAIPPLIEAIGRGDEGPNGKRRPRTFIEPCAGAGDLVWGLEQNYGWKCSLFCDIEPQHPDVKKRDAFDLRNSEYRKGDYIITNPPWKWELMEPLLKRFIEVRPTWLLLSADWAHNIRSSSYGRRYCKQIISVGRLSWMGNGKGGYDNGAWYFFSQEKTDTTIFSWRYENLAR